MAGLPRPSAPGAAARQLLAGGEESSAAAAEEEGEEVCVVFLVDGSGELGACCWLAFCCLSCFCSFGGGATAATGAGPS